MLEHLTDKLFDHAGMFPPAALSFEDALATAATFPTALGRPEMLQNDLVLTPENWRKLTDATLAAANFTRPCHVCLVGVDVDQAKPILEEAWDWNIEHATSKPPRVVTALEMHFSPGMALGTAKGRITAARYVSRGRIELYVEPKWDDATWNARLDELMALFDAFNADTELSPVGLKFRAWGDTALRPETLAKVLKAAVARQIPLKATQGLHHPLVEDHPQNNMGFLGLATAIRLAPHLAEADLVAALTETDAAAFDFDAATWRGHPLPKPSPVPFSIGSCSLAEPDADLARLF